MEILFEVLSLVVEGERLGESSLVVLLFKELSLVLFKLFVGVIVEMFLLVFEVLSLVVLVKLFVVESFAELLASLLSLSFGALSEGIVHTTEGFFEELLLELLVAVLLGFGGLVLVAAILFVELLLMESLFAGLLFVELFVG